MVRSGRQPKWKLDGSASSVYEALQLKTRDRITIPPRLLNTLAHIGIDCDQPLLAELDEPGMVRLSSWESSYAKKARDRAGLNDSETSDRAGAGHIQDGLLRLEIDSYDRRLKLPDIVLAHLEVNLEQTVWLHFYAFPDWFEIWSSSYRRQNRDRLGEISTDQEPVD